ncbi:T9SS type A sorting domain-containing protein [bacterium]|nr:T9SS type A sorting domain-containing protein [bacterium]
MTAGLRLAGTVLILFAFVVSPGFAQVWQTSQAGISAPWSVAADSSGEKIVVATEFGGYWISINSGESWQPWNHSITYTGMELAKTIQATDAAADTMLVTCLLRSGNTLDLHTFNGGATWSTYSIEYYWPGNLPHPTSGSWHVLDDPAGRVYFACRVGFARTADNGSNWDVYDVRTMTDDVNGLFVDPDDPDQLYIYGAWTNEDADSEEPSGGILYSEDGGVSWTRATEMETLTAGAEGEITDLTKLPNGDLLAVTVWKDTEIPFLVLLRSQDGGASWHWYPYQGLPDRFVAEKIEAVPDVPGRVLLTSSGNFGVWQSDDSGLSWNRLHNGLPDRPMPGKALYRNPFSGQLYVSLLDQGLYRSEDAGESLTKLTSPPAGIAIPTQENLPQNSSATWFNTAGGSIWLAQGESAEFTQFIPDVIPDNAAQFNGFTLPDGRIGYLDLQTPLTGTQSMITVMLSDNDGESWTASASTAIPEYQSFTELEAFTVDDETVLVGRDNFASLGWVSHDLGETWSDVSFDPHLLGPMHFHNGYFYAHEPNAIDVLRSSTVGSFWESTDFPRQDFLVEGCLKILSHNDAVLLAAGYTFWGFTENDGWVLRSYQNPTPTAWDLVETTSDTFLVAVFEPEEYYGLRVSDNLGYIWHPMETDFPYPQQSIGIRDLWFDTYRNRLWVDSHVGLSYLDFDETSVDEPWVFKPASFEMVSVYPNPFNAQTTIHYALPYPLEVKLDVFDVLGRHITTLAEGAYPAGSYEVTFDGSQLASGTYYLKGTAGQQSFERKLVLMK